MTCGRQVLAAATDHSDTAIRQAMLQSLKGQALMVTTTLPPNIHWKELLQALRIKYQYKAPYDVLMSQFYVQRWILVKIVLPLALDLNKS